MYSWASDGLCRAGSPRSDDEGGPALHVPYLQEPARHDVGAAERAALREELKGFLRVCELAKSGALLSQGPV